MEIREKTIIRASWISIAGNALLALSKIVLGLFSGSMAVVADGIDSASDIATSFITLITARLLSARQTSNIPTGMKKPTRLLQRRSPLSSFLPEHSLPYQPPKESLTVDPLPCHPIWPSISP